jgi:hypothetical protein
MPNTLLNILGQDDTGLSAGKRKKGRPRKIDLNDANVDCEKPAEIVEEVPKKKRGRKKKIAVEEEVKIKKKRGRKAAVKYFSSSIRKKIPLTTIISDNNNYILHLDIKNDKDDDDEMITFKPVEDVKALESMFEEMVISSEEMVTENLPENNIKNLYEQRLEYRHEQDKKLFQKLELLHSDETFLSTIDTEVMKDTLSTTPCKVACEIPNNVRKTEQSHNRRQGYFEMMYDFVHNTDWLHTTDAACWWCCHSFDSVPLGLPVYYNSNLKKYRVKGVFCSFACMKSFGKDNKWRYGETESMIKSLHNDLTGNMFSKITPAPTRYALKMFGGELTIEEFRNTDNPKMYKMVEYPLYISRDYIEEIDIASIRTANNKLFKDRNSNKSVLDPDRVNEARSRLQEKDKTTVTIGNTIDKFIKIY